MTSVSSELSDILVSPTSKDNLIITSTEDISNNGTRAQEIKANGQEIKSNGNSNNNLTNGKKTTMERTKIEEEPHGKNYGPYIVETDEEVEPGCCETEKQRLNKILKKKQATREAEFNKLQSQHRLDSETTKRVLALGFDDLVSSLQNRELTATEVLDAYIAKALEATSKFNCVTDFIPQATAWARELDSMDNVKGPLHGIPFCVKDDTKVEGMDCTHGFIKQLNQPAKESAVLVKILQELGGIPFCKTNVPQTLFTYGSDNPVFGTTTNCTNPKLSPGGSSSGTGSLVGARGSWFGTGTDIGGSLRIPAHFNGVSSIKPTERRLSGKGVQSSLPNFIGMTSVVGIIGQTPSVVANVFSHITSGNLQNKYDDRTPPIPFDNAIFKSKEKLRIGVITSLPYFPAMGDTADTVIRAKQSLESLGHTLVTGFNMPDQYHYMNVLGRFLMADQGRYFTKCWKGEKVAKSVALVYLSSFLPTTVQRLLGRLMNTKIFPFIHSKRTAVFFGAGATSSEELWNANGEKEKIMKQIDDEWDRLELDALLMPLMPFPAPPVDNPGLLPTAVVYSMIWNLEDMPAGIVPFGRESGRNIDAFDDEGDVALKLAKDGLKQSIGAPIGVQVVSRAFTEELCLRVMTELEKFSPIVGTK